MAIRSRVPGLLILLVIVPGCRRDTMRLDDVQKMVYSVKPAVVRVSAYATADFRYPPAAITKTEELLRADGFDFAAVSVPTADAVVDTGEGGSGSGFVINPDGVIMTCGHVVSPTRDPVAMRRELFRNGAIAALLKHFPVDALRTIQRAEALDRYIASVAGTARLDNVKVVNEVELSNGEKRPFRIRSFSPPLMEHGTDLALLQVDRRNLPTVRLADSDTVRVGDSIWAVGYPTVASSTDEVIGGWLARESDLEATVNPGIITAIKRNSENVPVLQSNVAIYKGNSGGPAVDREGAVVGISTWGRPDADQIKFLVPSNVARQMLIQAKVENAEGELDRHYKEALDAAANGNWPKANTQLAHVNTMFRGSPDLIRFQHDTDRAMRMLPIWKLHPYAVAVGGGVLAIGLVGGVILLANRRPRPPLDMDVVSTVETMVEPSEGKSGVLTMLGRFTILNGNKAGQRLGLGGSGIRIGRESTICEIVLENPKVSRLHAEVVSIDGKVLLIDRNSSNGTYVNDQKIDKRFLKDGDIIYFGGRNAVAVAYHA
jgi:serine protease Do